MITREFESSVTPEEIKAAFSDPDAFQVSKQKMGEIRGASRKRLFSLAGLAALFLIAGVATVIVARGYSSWVAFLGLIAILISPLILLLAIISHLRKPSQATAEESIRSYYKRILGEFPDYGKAYLLLASSAMKDGFATVYDFERTWKNKRRALVSSLKEAWSEPAVCSRCGAEVNGISDSQKWKLTDDILIARRAMLRCDGCEALYCSACFLELGRSRRCSHCERSLKNKFLEVLMTKPDIRLAFQPGEGSIEVVDGHDEHVVPFVYKVKASSILKAWEGDQWRPMGSEGDLVCRFGNTAVHIREQWFLLSGDLGRLS